MCVCSSGVAQGNFTRRVREHTSHTSDDGVVCIRRKLLCCAWVVSVDSLRLNETCTIYAMNLKPHHPVCDKFCSLHAQSNLLMFSVLWPVSASECKTIHDELENERTTDISVFMIALTLTLARTPVSCLFSLSLS